MDALSTKTLAAASAALVAGATYIDGHYAIKRDVKQLWRDRKFGQRLQERCRQLGHHATLYHHMELANPHAPALWFEGREWTYAEMKSEVDALAEILHHQGVVPGSFVAVFMSNSPEMVFTSLALSKLGAVPALINTALRNQTLLHCLGVAGSTVLVATPDLMDHLIPLLDDPIMAKRCISLNLGFFQSDAESLPSDQSGRCIQVSQADLIAAASNTTCDSTPRALKDIGVLIYTSGTTGKPKACSVKNFQLVLVSTVVPDDAENPTRYRNIRTFSCLPLFHATCFFTGLGYTMGTSGTFCLARKFSASGFTKALVDSRATRMLYVGELCRYLLKAPPSPSDKAHACKLALGNGLQKDIWAKFKSRFGIEEIREFYRSTEGVAKYDNYSKGAIGAGKVGFEGPIAHYFNNHTFLVRFDIATEAPWRDPKTGFCVKAKAGEPGEALGRITNTDFLTDYLNNPEASSEKLIYDVFEKGDVFQRMGDLLVHDRDGWIRFLDRNGDTYRWRSENVSAGEVREHISHLPGADDVTVYGIKLEGYDGQAGAAAITLNDPTPAKEEAFATNMYKALSARGVTGYQMPRLVRFLEKIDVNATFKHAKTILQTRSWDPKAQVVGETVWWLDGDTYRKLDEDSWTNIKTAQARL